LDDLAGAGFLHGWFCLTFLYTPEAKALTLQMNPALLNAVKMSQQM